jgi:hypothetical protein
MSILNQELETKIDEALECCDGDFKRLIQQIQEVEGWENNKVCLSYILGLLNCYDDYTFLKEKIITINKRKTYIENDYSDEDSEDMIED